MEPRRPTLNPWVDRMPPGTSGVHGTHCHPPVHLPSIHPSILLWCGASTRVPSSHLVSCPASHIVGMVSLLIPGQSKETRSVFHPPFRSFLATCDDGGEGRRNANKDVRNASPCRSREETDWDRP